MRPRLYEPRNVECQIVKEHGRQSTDAYTRNMVRLMLAFSLREKNDSYPPTTTCCRHRNARTLLILVVLEQSYCSTDFVEFADS